MIELLFTTTLSTILTVITLISIFVGVAQDKFWYPTLFVFGGIGLISYYHWPEMQDWMISNSSTLLWSVLAYLPFGFAYSIFKYKNLLDKEYTKCNESYAGNKDGIQRAMSYHTPSRHKDDIVGWIFYWPISLLAYILFDIIVDFKNWVYSKLEGIFQNIFKKYE